MTDEPKDITDPVQSVGIEAITILEERIANTEDEITQHIARPSDARKRREVLKAKLKQVQRLAGRNDFG